MIAAKKEELLKAVGWMSQMESKDGELFLSVSGGKLSLLSTGTVFSRAEIDVDQADTPNENCVVSMALFRKVLSTKTDQDVRLDITPESITVTDSRGKNKISCLAQKESCFPEKNYAAEIVSHTLSTYVRECDHARQKAEHAQRSFLSAFYIELGTDGSTFVLASDGLRISARGFITSPAKEVLVVPGKALYAFCSQNKGKTGIRVAKDRSGILLSGNGIEVYIPVSGADYSGNILAARNLSGSDMAVARTEDILGTLAQCNTVSKYLSMKLGLDEITIRNNGTYPGMQGFEGYIQARCRSKGDMSVCLNNSFLQEAVSSLSAEECMIALDGPNRPVVVTDGNDGATEVICARKAEAN